ncbi:M15 family metallopeptidase [Virgibacillus sp. Bac332]|uniref:M15 family metallopeptidase n=1 Tax=Virgibacillus sp. Bac332 TaxID=2419842 RepID=UPI000EF4FFD5|nr:M15 family metallopeptidase [Virgibacillus sp. Bac332]
MAVSLNTLLERSIRNMGNGMNQVVKQTALEVIKRAYKEGIYVQISDGYRSHAEQQKLYNQGRTTSGNIVTNAKPGQSLHNYGLAVDYFIVSDDGQKAIWTVNAKWKRVATIGKSLGFEWGGDWSSFKDYPHLQMTGGLTLSQLQAGKRPKLTSKVDDIITAPDQKVESETVTNWIKVTGDWKGQTLRNGQYGKPVKQLQTMLSKNDPPFYPNKGAKNNGIDEYYGDDTEDAVERYQSYYGLKRDGLAGKEVYGSLKENESNSKSKPSQAKGTVHLPASAKTWRTYKLNVKPVKKNSDWSLTPARYGGLTYKILDKPYPDVVTIKTGRGNRNIYVGSGTSAEVK